MVMLMTKRISWKRIVRYDSSMNHLVRFLQRSSFKGKNPVSASEPILRRQSTETGVASLCDRTTDIRVGFISLL